MNPASALPRASALQPLAPLEVAARLVPELRAVIEAHSKKLAELELGRADAWDVATVAVLRAIVRSVATTRSARPELVESGRLFHSVPGFESDGRDEARGRLLLELEPHVVRHVPEWRVEAEELGELYEALLAARPLRNGWSDRKLSGSYYTPRALTEIVARQALAAWRELDGAGDASVRVLDPALGAGAFLIQSARELSRLTGAPLAHVVRTSLYGIDLSPLAVAVAESCLWLLAEDESLSLASAGERLRQADALCSPEASAVLGRRALDIAREFPEVERGFDLVIGNPPWVAYAGRAAQPLPAAQRRFYRRTYAAFRGYPTLHGLFVERAASYARHGVVALLLPSPIADLAGYRFVRSTLAATHAAAEPLLEFGQDAFPGVTQPCFALVAVPRRAAESDPERELKLRERSRAAAQAVTIEPPRVLRELLTLPPLPRELFGEMGFQSSRRVSEELFFRGDAPPLTHDYPLLEGRNVSEFRAGPPRLFMKADPEVLRAARCTLRARGDYLRVKFVVRQTAAIPIAALHEGVPFRNSLLAGFELPDYPAAFTVGLLNSTLYRALHLAARRDARQAAFPQVKVAHLRALPRPTTDAAQRQLVESATFALTRGDAAARATLDAVVFASFGIDESRRRELVEFVRARAPGAGLWSNAAPLAGASADTR